jgi:rare lipoprotein A
VEWRSAAVALVLVGASGCYRSARPEPAGRGAFIGEGLASYYGPDLEGHRTASGEIFDPRKLTAAHRSIRFGTCLTVVNVQNQRSVNVRINDRGPFSKNRIVDVSQAAAEKLGMIAAGVVTVRLYLCAR